MAELETNPQVEQKTDLDSLSTLKMPSLPSFSEIADFTVGIVSPLLPGKNKQEKVDNLTQCSAALGKLFSVVPGVATLSTMLNATTRAAYWLGTADWGKELSEGLGLKGVDTSAYEEETKKILGNITSLQKSAPEMKKIAESIAGLREQLKEMKEDPNFDKAKAAKLEKQMRGELRSLSELLDQNTEVMEGIRDGHQELLEQMRADLEQQGKSTEEIDKELAPLIEAKATRDKIFEEMTKSTIEALEGVRELSDSFATAIEGQIKEYREHSKGHGDCDKGLIEKFERLAKAHRERMGYIEERLIALKKQLEKKAVGGETAENLGEIVSEVEETSERSIEEGQKLSKEKRESLRDMGVSHEVLAEMEKRDNGIWGMLKSLASSVVGAVNQAAKDCQSYLRAQEAYVDTHISFLRSHSAMFHGGAGWQQLSLGLFDGPYALTALSFMSEHENILRGLGQYLNAEEQKFDPNARTYMYAQRPEKSTEDFYADFLKTESTIAESVLATTGPEVKRESEKADYERRTGTTVVGDLSESQKFVQNTSRLLQKDTRTFLQPVGNKTEKDIVSS